MSCEYVCGGCGRVQLDGYNNCQRCGRIMGRQEKCRVLDKELDELASAHRALESAWHSMKRAAESLSEGVRKNETAKPEGVIANLREFIDKSPTFEEVSAALHVLEHFDEWMNSPGYVSDGRSASLRVAFPAEFRDYVRDAIKGIRRTR